MGTNYYAYKIEDIMSINTSSPLNAFLSSKNLEKIHIGKASYGWDFLYNHNDWKYYRPETMYAFLEECIIIDEYDRVISLSEFKSIAINRKMYNERDMKYFENHGNFIFSNSTEFS